MAGAGKTSVGATSAVNGAAKEPHTTPAKQTTTRRSLRRRGSNSDTAFKPDRAGSDLEDHMVTKPRASRAKSETPRKTTPTARTKKASPASTGKAKTTRTSKASTTPSKSGTRAKKTEKRTSASVDSDGLVSTPVPKRTRVRGLDKITPPESGPKQNGHSVMFQDVDSSGEDGYVDSIPDTPVSNYSSSHEQSPAPKTVASTANKIAKATAAAAMSIVNAATQSAPSTPINQANHSTDSPKTSQSRGKASASSNQAKSRPSALKLKKGKRPRTGSSSEYEADEDEDDDEEISALDLSADPMLDELKNPRDERRASYERYRPEKDEESPIVVEPKPESVFRDADVDALRRLGQDRLAKRRQQRKEEFADLTEQEYNLFEKLDHRGYESFVPVAWHLDFPFGLGFYYGDSPDDTHIRPVNFHDGNANFRAMNALKALLRVGPIVRDRYLYSHLRPERFLRNQFRAYQRWADTDAKTARFDAPNLLSIAFDDSADGLASIDAILSKLEHRMLKNVQSWRNWHKWHTSPEVIDEYESRMAMETAGEDAMDLDVEDTPSLSASDVEDLDEDMSVSDPGPPSSGLPPQTPAKGWFASLKDKLMGHGVSVTPAHGHLSHRHEASGENQTPTPKHRGKDIVKSPSRNHIHLEPINQEEEYTGPIDAVYGIAVLHLVVVILSLPINDPGDEDAGEDEVEDDSQYHDEASRNGNGSQSSTGKVERNTTRRRARVLFYLDFSVPAEDVWNAVAVAMTVCHCRDLQIEAVRRVHERRDGDEDGKDVAG